MITTHGIETLRSRRMLLTGLWKRLPLIGKLWRIFKVVLLISKDRDAYRSIKGFVYHLSRLDELPPDQFFANIINWSRDFAAWQRNTIEPARKATITLQYQPIITIIMPIFGYGGGRIKETFVSMNRQYYQNWELYLLVDKKPQLQLSQLIKKIFEENQEIKIKYRPDLSENLAGALNEVLNECKGEFIGFLSASDQLTRNALLEVVNVLNQNLDVDIIYSDEGKKARETLIHLFCKPSWSRDLFFSLNYLRNFLCCRTDLIRAVSGFHGEFEDDIKYDLVLRILEKKERVYHIPKTLYYEQVLKSDYPRRFTADYSFELHKKSLESHIKRRGIQAEVCDGIFKGSFRVRRKILNQPKVSIIIPTKDKLDHLKRCIESIESKTSYRNFEIIIVDNGSKEIELLKYLKASPHEIIRYPKEFNYSKINNFGARHADGNYLLFLNDDTQVICSEWLEAMLEHSQREEVGIVGAKLLYPNGLIQHGGMVLERNRVRQIDKFANLHEHGYYGMADVIRNFNVVTGACLMIRKQVFREVSGFEENLSIIYNDVDICLKVRSRGYFVVYTPYAVLYHHEGISQWSDLKEEADSVHSFYSWWNEFIEDDSYFEPNYFSIDQMHFG